MNNGVKLFGDWKKASKLAGSMANKWKIAAARAQLQEAQFLRSKIVEGIREQSPGGEPFRPLSPITLAIRSFEGFKGKKALLRRGDLRNSILVHKVAGGKTFVGVLRTARSKTGKSLINVAELNEYGSRTIVIPITPASSRFYHAALRRAGIESQGKHHGGGTPIAIMRIPARPFIAPVGRKYARPEDVKKRFYTSVLKTMGPDYKLPAGFRSSSS